MPKMNVDKIMAEGRTKTPQDFLTLLKRCQAQVEARPASVTNNSHLHSMLHSIFLRLCGGDIDEWAVTDAKGRISKAKVKFLSENL